MLYRKVGMTEMRPYIPGEDLTGISVSDDDDKHLQLDDPGGMIATGDKPTDRWYVAQEFFEDNYEAADGSEKSLGATDVDGAKGLIPDIKVFGDGDMFRLLCKAHSEDQGWMKSTKAMEILGAGCVVQVTTQQGDNVAEALVFVPGVYIKLDHETGGRKLAKS